MAGDVHQPSKADYHKNKKRTRAGQAGVLSYVVLVVGEKKKKERGEGRNKKNPKKTGDAPVSIGEETIGVRMEMLRVNLVSRSTCDESERASEGERG